MLGRLAKGVGGLAKGVAGVALGEARAALTAVPNDESEVEGLLQRISGSLLPEYRRQAMSQLKDLLVDNPKAQLAFGTMGIPILVAVLRDDRDDVALLQGALEALVAATTSTSAAGGDGVAAGEHGHTHAHPHAPVTAAEAQAAAVNAELLTRQREHVGLLLGLLEDEPIGVSDFYVRYHTVQLLTALLNHCAERLQEAILATPMSVARLTELLGERSEVIRNEALLLLAALTRSEGQSRGGGSGGSEVQKIAAFEGAFDRVAELLREEGGLEGGMVVQDCIELMNNLLRGNIANQRLFREMGHIGMLPGLITSAVPSTAAAGGGGASGAAATSSAGQFQPAAGPIPFLNGGGGGGADGGGDEPSLELHNALAALAAAGTSELLGPRQLPRQKAANMLSLMETLRLLCGAPVATADPDRATEQSNRAANQAKLLAAGTLEALTAAALQDGGVPSAPVRAAALGALGDLVDGAAAGRERLSRATVRQGLAAAAAGEGSQAAVPATAEPVPTLQAVLHVALYGSDAAERTAADHVIACYCRGNADGQLGLAATIGGRPEAPGAAANGGGYVYGNGVPPGQHSEVRTSFGEDLVAALLAGGGAAATAGSTAGSRHGSSGSGGLLVTCRAAGVLQHLLSDNGAVKQRLLATPLEAPPGPGVPPDYLMPRVVRHLTAALRPPHGDLPRLVICTLLRLLLVWLHDCPAAVAALLDGPAHLPLMVDLVTGRQGPAAPAEPPAAAQGSQGGDPVACGLAACVLASCMLYGKPLAAPTLAAPTPAAADLVLDVVMSRIGLSLFFFRLDDLKRSAVFAAAATAPYNAAKPLTRAAAAAAVAAAEQAAAGAAPAADGAATAADAFQLGHDMAGVVSRLEDDVRQRTMEAFARPAGHRGQDPVPSSPGEVPGHDDVSRLGWAVAQLGRLAREMDELRGRNRALAEDLFRLSQGLGTAPPAPPAPGAAPMVAPAPGPPSAASGAPGHGPPHHHAVGPAAAAAVGPSAGPGLGVGVGMGVMTSAADVEARVALELRAGRAEAEVAALRQQLELVAARLSQAEADAAAAREVAAAAHLAASKAEADLADLSGAYNNLETHAFATEAQLRSAQGALAAAQAAAAQAEARVAAAEARAVQAASAAGHVSGPSEADIQQRIEEAVANAKAEVEDGMTDLFVCLGQEERKVEVLSRALAGFGVNVEEMLAGIVEAEPSEDLR